MATERRYKMFGRYNLKHWNKTLSEGSFTKSKTRHVGASFVVRGV
jgi:hypothetical protein